MIFKNVTHNSRINDSAPLILVVEEDADTRLMLKYLLNIWKYRVIEAADPEDAVRQAYVHRPHLILLNVKFQKNDALADSRRLRETSRVAPPEIIFVADRAHEMFHAAALAEGIRDVLIKPIDFGALEKILDNRLRKNERRAKTPFTEAV